MSKHSIKHTLALVLGLAVPVMALTGCPLPGFGGTTPSPTPTVAATPSRATGIVLTKVDFPTGDVTGRAVTVKNLGTAEVDLDKYVVSYEYYDGTTAKMQHLRFAKGKKLGAGLTLTFKDNATDLTKEDLGGTGATTMGLQLGHGSLVLYKGVTAAADLTKANMTDYLQYGTTKTYTHAADAVSGNVWDAADKYATAATSLGQSLNAKVAGNIGSANWEVK